VGGCGFWFVVYLIICVGIFQALNVNSVWAVLPISIVVMIIVALLRALLIAAFDEGNSFGILFRVVVLIVFMYLLATNQYGMAFLVLGLFSFLELVVTFS